MDDLYKQYKKYVWTRRVIVAILIWAIVLTGVVGFNPGSAHAFIDFNQSIFNIFKIPFDIIGRVLEQANKAYEKLGAMGFRQALKSMVNNIAVDTATYLATGDKGQAPMFQTSFKDYIQQEGDAFLGDALNNQIKKKWGVDLCKPIDQLAKVNIEITAKEFFRKQKPQCSFTKMMKNIKDVRKIQLIDLPAVADMFNPASNELGALLTITTEVQEGQQNKIDLAKLELKINQGWKAVTSKISGKIKTPAAITALLGVKPIEWSLDEKKVFTGELTADFIGPFANTLMSKLMKKYKEGLVNDQPTTSGYGPNFGIGQSPVQAARERFADLGETNYQFGGKFDVISKLTCDNTSSQYSCVIDDGLRMAIMEEPPITVGEALNKGFLHGDWPLGFKVEGKSGGTATTQEQIYSYRSLVIMRKYRIVPVGWELAAEYFGRFDNSPRQITLNSLIEDYDNPASPYYKLVDPNWVLKAPENICLKQGPGELVDKETIIMSVDSNFDGVISEDEKNELVIRFDYCADERSCIKEGAQGCEYYGYCTKEKPVWSIHGTQCDPVFNTCRAYKTRDGVEVGYLTNTLSGLGECDENDVGCREYLEDWVPDQRSWDESASADRIYLNKRASDNECSEDQTGCSRFIRVSTASLADEYTEQDLMDKTGEGIAKIIVYESSPKTNLRKAPEYYNCQGYTKVTGTDKNSCSGFWRDDIESCVESGRPECADYALSCDTEDVGCRFFSPVSYTGPKVPGVAGENYMCPAECVGFKSYLEQPSFFEPVIPATRENPMNFIATAATVKTCPASHNGCEEFTNLSEGSSGERKEYYSSMRYCVLPGSSGVQTYYSWASSEESGNQLRSWQLLAGAGGAPCTNIAGVSTSCIDNSDKDHPAHTCSFNATNLEDNPVYNPDCIEFIDAGGNSYWMKYSRVVFASDECIPMRRTQDQLVYTTLPRLSQTCSPSSVGCREYKGSAANNIEIVLNDDFEDGTDQGWQGGIHSNESIIANGHSYQTSGEISKIITGLIHKNRSYKLSFWAKATGGDASISNSSIYFSDGKNSSYFSGKETALTGDWNYYVFNLINLDREIGQSEGLYVGASNTFYLDNIQLTETKDDLYLIRDSWLPLPAACGADMVGCEHYKDEKNKDWYLRSFTKLCRDEVVGCEMMIDMHNTDNPAEETFSANDPAVTVLADNLEYLVYDEKKKCSSVGCRALGQVFVDRNSNTMADTKYLIVDENNYGGQTSPLCSQAAVWCEAFSPIGGGLPEYFKFPGVFTCEYSQGPDGQYRWYQAGDNTALCPETNAINLDDKKRCLGGRSMIDGNDLSNICDNDANCVDYASMIAGGSCSNWTGLCPIGQDKCAEYQDPANPAGCDNQAVNGESGEKPHCDYYYYKSNSVATCSAEELRYDPGCRAFHAAGGGDDKYFSTPRCEGAEEVSCEDDADCASAGGSGKCVYQ